MMMLLSALCAVNVWYYTQSHGLLNLIAAFVTGAGVIAMAVRTS